MSDKKSDTNWWGEHYRINAQWLIIKLNTLVNADLNAESAALLTLQTRQQLGTIGLSIAQQSEQSILRLF